ncbi:glycosyltransferase family 4 protein [Cellulomonas fimi]|uniref:Glycosyltransferase family 4 protein n=1 Tax=Cellulomonas fimi TaxID=1708 RepID=A0A7Y0M0U2_CELFI|nr:glycosyltransferase family 4 protein [Cellulomonas fimi]NMR21440.1 glycosyltransferase family 4 protein [Cellulomonas fimi]
MSAVDGVAFMPPNPHPPPGRTDLRCGLVADHLDVGGIGRVIEMLTEGLRSAGIEPVVVCPRDGERSARLRALGYEVIVAPDARSAGVALESAGLDVVELHSAPAHLVGAVLGSDVPVLPVLHNTEIHYARLQWRATAALFGRAEAVIAVSEIVRRFHLERLPATPHDKIVVVPNGAMTMPQADASARSRAREHLASVLGARLTKSAVFVSLVRYDSQKNVAGTVASFLEAADSCHVPVHLVVAGEPSDWLEYCRADALRRRHPRADRVHLLGNSDAATLLAAADAFLLNSFFEGWPLATTEAVAAGLPIVVSDSGGAAELVARAPEGSMLIGNATGPAGSVSDRSARAARRRAARQRNRPELAAAVSAVATAVAQAATGGPGGPADDSYGVMVDGHARLLRAVGRTRSTVIAPSKQHSA